MSSVKIIQVSFFENATLNTCSTFSLCYDIGGYVMHFPKGTFLTGENKSPFYSIPLYRELYFT
jgi:hypothetical protein